MASGTFYPGVGGDDGYFTTADAFDNSGNQLFLGAPGGTATHNFYRFPSVTIPAGSTITLAYVRVTSSSNESGTTCNVNCYFNNVDDAIAPTTGAGANALALTAAIAWNALAAWTSGVQYDTPSLVTILQAIIDRVGWVSGQAVQVILRDNASTANADRAPGSIEWNAGVDKAELWVEWEIASSSSSSSSSRSSSSSSSSRSSSSSSSSSRSSSSSSSSSRSSSSSSSSRSSSSSSSSSKSSSSSSSSRSSSSSSSSRSSSSSSSSSRSSSSSSSSRSSSSSSSSSKSSSSSSISFHKFSNEIQLDVEIIRTSHLYGYIRDWRGHIVRKVCSIIVTSTDGITFYGKTTSDPVTGYFYLRVNLASASDILLTSYYEGTYRGQTNIAGSEIVTTGSSSSSSSRSSSSSSSSSSASA